MPEFRKVINTLISHYGRPRKLKTKDPLHLVLYENIGYLIDDKKREAAFTALGQRVGLSPTDILRVSTERLVEITRLGGIHAEMRARRLQEIAQIALNDFAGDLRIVLKLPLQKAIKELKKFPAIGTPGAEKILMFSRAHPLLALDSNGLRVLLRLGFGVEQRNYAASYKSVQTAVKDEIGNDYNYLIAAHTLLRQHGQELCRNNNPVCELCPLKSQCNFYRTRGITRTAS